MCKELDDIVHNRHITSSFSLNRYLTELEQRIHDLEKKTEASLSEVANVESSS